MAHVSVSTFKETLGYTSWSQPPHVRKKASIPQRLAGYYTGVESVVKRPRLRADRECAWWPILALALGLQACASEVSLPDGASTATENTVQPYAPLVSEDMVRELLSEDWAGFELGMALPRAHDMGPNDRAYQPKPLEGGASTVDPGAELPATKAVIMSHKGHWYRMEVPLSRELGRIVTERRERHLEAMAQKLAAEEQTQPSTLAGDAKALVVTAETPDPLGIANKKAVDGWYAAIGEIDGSCTGTLISRRTIITAGHCVVIAGTGNPSPKLRFVPRADGTDTKTYPDKAPYGTWTVDDSNADIVYPDEFWDNKYGVNCGVPSGGSYDCSSDKECVCVENDWAIVKLRSPQDPFPPMMPPPDKHLTYPDGIYMGFGARKQDDKIFTRLRQRGYPSCDEYKQDTGRDCIKNTLYGNTTQDCTVAEWLARPKRGVVGFTPKGCKTYHGDSGSPYYGWEGKGYPTIVGTLIGSPDKRDDIDRVVWISESLHLTFINFLFGHGDNQPSSRE